MHDATTPRRRLRLVAVVLVAVVLVAARVLVAALFVTVVLEASGRRLAPPPCAPCSLEPAPSTSLSPKWTPAAVTYMSSMFCGASVFN
jgi:hypothetical protein